MGFAVIHMMKIGKGGLRGIQSHNQRERDSRSNPDIDKSRSKNNYELIGNDKKNYTQEVNRRIESLACKTKTVRKDAVVLCNFIITSDEQTMKALSPAQQRGYFEDSVKFLSQRYGAERIVNATVHMDETTPHLHVGIVPITDDGRLSAKSIFTRTELQSLQTDFASEVGSKYELERGVEGSERTHLSEQRFKAERAQEQALKARISVLEAQKELEGIKQALPSLKAEFKARKAYVESMSKDFTLIGEGVQENKALLGGKVKSYTVSAEKWETQAVTRMDREAQKRADKAFEESIEDFNNTDSAETIRDLSKQVKELKKQNKTLVAENRSLNQQVTQAEKRTDKAIERVNKVLDKLPDEVADQFVKEWKAMEQAQAIAQSMDMIR